MSVTAGRRLGARAACPAGYSRAPAPAVVNDVNQAQARSASGVPAASRSTGTLARCCLPAGQGNFLPVCCAQPCGSLVQNGAGPVRTLGECWGSCCQARAGNRALTWESAIRTLCIEKKPELSTRRAATAHK
jgi:hypothetical protein